MACCSRLRNASTQTQLSFEIDYNNKDKQNPKKDGNNQPQFFPVFFLPWKFFPPVFHRLMRWLILSNHDSAICGLDVCRKNRPWILLRCSDKRSQLSRGRRKRAKIISFDGVRIPGRQSHLPQRPLPDVFHRGSVFINVIGRNGINQSRESQCHGPESMQTFVAAIELNKGTLHIVTPGSHGLQGGRFDHNGMNDVKRIRQ